MNVAVGVVRSKVLAVLIGTDGIGIFGAYSSLATFLTSVAGMGISSSGVRQIAEANGTGDPARIARSAAVLRRIAITLGVVGAALGAALAIPLSVLTFGSRDYSVGTAMVGCSVCFATVSGAQAALIQGMRHIRWLAAINVWSAVLGTALSLPIPFLFHERGIPAYLVALAAVNLAITTWYSRRLHIPRVPLQFAATMEESRTLVSMGAAFAASGFMTSGVAYAIRVLIIRELGIEAAGLFQAAWTISSVYVGFILGAMAADYYPRLTSLANNDDAANQLINEQAEASLLMAMPGILATLAFAPIVLQLMYAPPFAAAGDVLRWQVLGVMGRVVTWPLAFLLLAKARAAVYFWTELGANLLHIALAWLGIRLFGLEGIGMAFFALYLVYGIAILIISGRLSGFRYSRTSRRAIAAAGAFTLVSFFLADRRLPQPWSSLAAAPLLLLALAYSATQLAARAGFHSLSEGIRSIRSRLRSEHH